MTRRNLDSARDSPNGRRLLLSLLVATLAAVVLGACSTRTRQPVEPGDAVGGARVEAQPMVYAKPGVGLDRYSEIVVDPFMISYERQPRSTGFTAVEAQRSLTLDPDDEVKFAGAARKAFVRSMRRSRHFSVVEEPGPQTLHVQGWVFDLVLAEPKLRYLPICDSEMTLTMTVRDAQTAEALAYVSHRFPMRCAPREFLEDPEWGDVTRALQPWASRLREHLHGLAATSKRDPARSVPLAVVPLNGVPARARS
jgi:hypothetical protein